MSVTTRLRSRVFVFRLLLAVVFSASLLSNGCKPTYQRATIQQSVKELAKKEYKIDVDVAEAGDTLGVRFRVKNLLSQLYSGEEALNRQIYGLFIILVRVSLSIDAPPRFVVLEVVDEDNPRLRIEFTRYVEDIRKAMAEVLSYTDIRDRLIEELVVGQRKIPFDPGEMDLIRLMMLATDSEQETVSLPTFAVTDIQFNDFVARVAENVVRRVLREDKKMKDDLLVRNVTASFKRPIDHPEQFKVFLDLVSQPRVNLPAGFLEGEVLPLVAKEIGSLFKSYRVNPLSDITVVEKNSGKMLTVSPR